MTTYADLWSIPAGTRVKFVADTVFKGDPDLVVPAGTLMAVVSNDMPTPQDTLTLHPYDLALVDQCKAFNHNSDMGTVNIGPEQPGDAGLAETAPVDVVT